MNSQTITTLKADLEKNMKLEGFSEIYRGVILKYMDLAYTMGQRDQIKEDNTDMLNGVSEVEKDLHKLHYDNYPPRDN